MNQKPSNDVHDLFRQIVATLWDRSKHDADFRTKLLADPEGTLKSEGLDEVYNFINRLKSADPAALEAALQSNEKTPTC
jgi:hypothetical protein